MVEVSWGTLDYLLDTGYLDIYLKESFEVGDLVEFYAKGRQPAPARVLHKFECVITKDGARHCRYWFDAEATANT